MSADAEEKHLVEMIRLRQEAYLRDIDPFVKRLVLLRTLRAPREILVPLDQIDRSLLPEILTRTKG